MLHTVEGIYRDGKIELSESPQNVGHEARVLVTFLSPGAVDLSSRGIDQTQAADLRSRLATFAEDWESPEMVAYDDYENNRRKLEAG